MTNSKWIALGFLLLFSACNSGPLSYNLEYTAADLQEKIEKKFPYEIEQKYVQVRLKEPKVVLKEGQDTIGVKIRAEVAFRKLPFKLPPTKGSVYLNGKLRFDRQKGALYVFDPELKQLDIVGLPNKLDDALRKLAGGPLLKKHFEKHPLHTLKEDTFKQSLTKMMLKSVSVKKGVLIVELAVF